MEARSLPQALNMIMETRGWSQSDLARELGVSQMWVSEVSRGIKDTRMAKSIRLLAQVGWEVRISPRAEGPVERREFVAAAASVIFVPSRKTSPFEDPSYLRTLTESLARNRYELGGLPLVSNALGQMRRAESAAAATRKNKALQIAISELANQASLILYDAGKMGTADRVGRFSLECAIRAGDFEAQARSYDSLSRICVDQGDAVNGVRYAQQGVRLHEVSASQLASLHMRLGRALALIPGQVAVSRSSLDSARNIGGLSPFGEAALVGDVGIGLDSLRAYREAGQLLNEAAESIGQWSPLFRAQYLGRQALTALRSGDASHAADRIDELARALPFVSSARVNKRVKEVLTLSADWASVPEVRDAREYLLAMVPHK